MAYTAPNDLFTSEEAILSLASSIADEDRTNLGNGTINGALDVLADALAERNVEVPPMNAGAILALADYVSGGGGGGGDFTIAQVTITYDHEDTVNAGIMLPVVDEAAPPFRPEASSDADNIDFTPDTPVPVILYKGKCRTSYFGTGTVTTSGNATYESHQISITGDCSITIS